MIAHSLASPEGRVSRVPRPPTARGEDGDSWNSSLRDGDSQSLSFRVLGATIAFLRRERLAQFIKFCLVGGSGVFVDMGMLFLLADPKCLGLNLTLSKVLAAESALANNFLWNELWTFRQRPSPVRRERVPLAGEGKCPLSAPGGEGRGEVPAPRFTVSPSRRFAGIARRFLLFNAICGVGIALAVLLLHLFHSWLGWNLYLSNLLAIILVTCWNFGMSALICWPSTSSPKISSLLPQHPLSRPPYD